MTTYDHGSKAGNRADVWKHFILIQLLTKLCAQKPADGNSFCYIDSHSAQGLFTLNGNGAWQSGIGRKELLEYSGMAYFDIALSELENGQYPGSWQLVRRFLSQQEIPCRVQLFDTSTEVKKIIIGHNIENLSFKPMDGYTGLHNQESYDLLLIDPPFVPDPLKEYARLLACIEKLEKQSAWLAWYPILGNSAEESAFTFPGYTRLEIEWKSGPTMCGCGMVCSDKAAQLLVTDHELLRKLANSLDGRFTPLKM